MCAIFQKYNGPALPSHKGCETLGLRGMFPPGDRARCQQRPHLLLEYTNMPAERGGGVQGQRTGLGQKGKALPAEGGPKSILTTLATDQSPMKCTMNVIFKEELFPGCLTQTS